MAEGTKVELENNLHGWKQTFSFEHAEAILFRPRTAGWELPKNSKFEFDNLNGLRSKPNKSKNTGSEEVGLNQ